MSSRIERLRDEIAILEYRAGDVDALGGLISRWQERIYRYICAIVREREAAWDVSQEVWLAALAALRKGSKIACFEAWLYRLAHNKAVSHLRGKRRRTRALEALRDAAPQDASEGSDTAEAGESVQLVHECLQALGVAQREAVTLFYLEDLTVEEIAGILAAPPGTVQSRLHYARAKLRECLSRKGYRHGER